MNEYHDVLKRTYVASASTSKTEENSSGKKTKTTITSCSQKVVPTTPGRGTLKGTTLPLPSCRVEHPVYRCPEEDCEFCLNLSGRPLDGGYNVNYIHVHTCTEENDSFKNGKGHMNGAKTNYTTRQLAETVVNEFVGENNAALSTDAINALLENKVVPAKYNPNQKGRKTHIGGIKNIKQAVRTFFCFVVVAGKATLIQDHLFS